MDRQQIKSWLGGQTRELSKTDQKTQLEVFEEAGILDTEQAEFLQGIQRYNADAGENKNYRRILKKNSSTNLRKAIKNSNLTLLSHFTGIQDNSVNMSQVEKYERLRNWIDRTAGITYIAGHMGTGKTDFAILLSQVWKQINSEGEVASNISSHRASKTITSQADLLEWIQEDGEKLFVFDEASSHASGYIKDKMKVEKYFSSLVKFIRKNQGKLIIIGHTGKDIHPDIRRLSNYIQKESKKEAKVYESVENGEGETQKFKLENIPACSEEFDTREESSWKWDKYQKPDTLPWACYIYNNTEMSQKEVEILFDTSRTKISQNKEKYQSIEDIPA
jgi:hypothetical protein